MITSDVANKRTCSSNVWSRPAVLFCWLNPKPTNKLFVKKDRKEQKQRPSAIKLPQTHVLLSSATIAMRPIRKSFHKDIERHVILTQAASRNSRLNKSNMLRRVFHLSSERFWKYSLSCIHEEKKSFVSQMCVKCFWFSHSRLLIFASEHERDAGETARLVSGRPTSRPVATTEPNAGVWTLKVSSSSRLLISVNQTCAKQTHSHTHTRHKTWGKDLVHGLCLKKIDKKTKRLIFV